MQKQKQKQTTKKNKEETQTNLRRPFAAFFGSRGKQHLSA